MPYRPFLSHKREQASELELLREELVLRGVGGWQDVTDLRLGQRFKAAFSRAIGRETGGFIWWGTPTALKSKTIGRVEVPSALRRSRSRRDGPYPFVPLFVDLRPGRDDVAIKKAFGRRHGQQLLDLQGLVRDDDEELPDFARRAARRYLHDLIREHDKPELRIAVTGGRPPSGQHDLALDWRRLLDASGRVVDSAVLPTLIETLSDIRNAAHETWDCPHLIAEPTVRLPLGALMGWEWNRVRPVKLTVVQPSARGAMEIEDLPGDTSIWPSPQRQELGGGGPAVLAVSVGKNLGNAVQRYSEAHAACETVHLHVDLGRYPGGVLPAADICSLAEWVIGQLADLNARGLSKHLLLLGPVSLAVRVGAAANGTGRTFVPFWDGADGYTSGVLLG